MWLHDYESWRWERDSNPRYAINVYTLSRRAPSATRTPHHGGGWYRKKTSLPSLKQLICRKSLEAVLWFAKMLSKTKTIYAKYCTKSSFTSHYAGCAWGRFWWYWYQSSLCTAPMFPDLASCHQRSLGTGHSLPDLLVHHADGEF